MKMPSSSEENYALATRVAQEEMAQIVSPTSHGKETTGNQAIHLHGKRKKLDALMHVFTSDTASLNKIRRRKTFHLASSSPRGAGFVDTSPYKKGGSSDVVKTGETLRKTHFNSSLESSGFSHSVSPPSPSTVRAQARISGRNTLSGVHEATTSAQGSGLANQSTVTTSSIGEEEESTSLHSLMQTSKVGSETKGIVNLFSSIRAVGTGSIGSRQAGTHARHEKRAKTQVNRTTRIRDGQRDGEVLSPFSNVFASLACHVAKVDRVSGSTLRDFSYGERSGKTETTCVLNSGCSSIKAGKRERARLATDDGTSIRQHDDSSELMLSGCSRELNSSSIGPGPCLSSCSNSIPSGLVTPYQPYRPMGPSRMKGSVVLLSRRDSVIVNESLATEFATDKCKGKSSEVAPETSHAPSHAEASNASEQETENSSSPTTECKSFSGDAHLRVDDGQTPAPTFVLSSGRMSQDEASRLGLRPSTIDDDFDEYFAQLML